MANAKASGQSGGPWRRHRWTSAVRASCAASSASAASPVCPRQYPEELRGEGSQGVFQVHLSKMYPGNGNSHGSARVFFKQWGSGTVRLC